MTQEFLFDIWLFQFHSKTENAHSSNITLTGGSHWKLKVISRGLNNVHDGVLMLGWVQAYIFFQKGSKRWRPIRSLIKLLRCVYMCTYIWKRSYDDVQIIKCSFHWYYSNQTSKTTSFSIKGKINCTASYTEY